MKPQTKQLVDLTEAVRFLEGRLGRNRPSCPIAVVGGSSWGFLAQHMHDVCLRLPYKEIPGFPGECTAPDHSGELIFGKMNGVDVIFASGRIHLYEGYTALEVVYLSRLLAMLGCNQVILTNAAGGMGYQKGDLVMIKDHLNLTGNNPFRGMVVEQFGKHFPDMTHIYSVRLRQVAQCVTTSSLIVHDDGIYAGVMGPTYETPAEIRAFVSMGATLVGMSTVLEAMALEAMGVEVAGISCVSNPAAGWDSDVTEITEEEVAETLQQQQPKILTFIKRFILAIAQARLRALKS